MLVPLALVAGGLAAGGLMIACLGGAPLLLSLPPERYVPVHQFLVTRFDPFMPICMISALLLDIVLGITAPSGVAQGFAAAGAVLYLAAMYVSLSKNVPINKWVGRLDPGTLPDDWQRIDPRVRWRNWNLVRTAAAVSALVANAVVVAVLL